MKSDSPKTRFINAALALLAAGLLIFSGAACSTAKAVQAHVERGESYLKERRFPEASLEFRSAIELDKASAPAHFGLARAFEGQQRLAETVEELRRTVELDKTQLEARVKLGNYLLMAQPHVTEETEKLIQEIFAAEPNYIEGHVLQASVMAVKNAATSEVVAQLEKAVSLNPQRVETYLSLARFYVSREKTDDAEKTFRRAFAVNEKSATAHIEYARFLDLQGRASDAEKHYLRATEVGPKEREPLEALAGFYYVQRQFEKAENAYKNLGNLNPDRPEEKTLLADFYAAINRPADARRVYSEILAVKPEFVRAQMRLGELYLQTGDERAAAAQVTEILSRNNKDVQGLTLRARISLKNGEPETAIKDLQEVLKQEPGNRLALYYMADAQFRAGQTEQARNFIQDLQRYHPNYLHAKLLNAQISFATDEPQTALNQANELLKALEKAAPNSEISAPLLAELRVNALLARGMANLQLGKEPEARADFQIAQKHAPNSVNVYLSQASAAQRSKNTAEAASFYEKALQLDSNNFDGLSGFVSAKMRQKDFTAAHSQIDRAFSTNQVGNKMQAALFYLKAGVFAAENKTTEAENALHQSIAANADYLPAYQAYAALLVANRQVDRALENYRQILQRSPASDETFTLIGMLEEGRGNADAAVENYRGALRVNPNAPVAANNLAWIIADTGRGNLDEAVTLAQTLVEKHPNEPVYADTLGWVFHKKGQKDRAIAQLRRAVSLEEKAALQAGRAPAQMYKNRLGTVLAAADNRAAL
ncbi:MAG TPA: tetratricopeptide repeat protein [Pyrinomonadaceae bacterium]|jgi:tetratricopeptide (TPR) repeat protein